METECRAWGGVRICIRFHVFDVARPLLSLGLLRGRSFNVVFGGDCAVQKGQRTVPLMQKGLSLVLSASAN